jgi:hypothetical protein
LPPPLEWFGFQFKFQFQSQAAVFTGHHQCHESPGWARGLAAGTALPLRAAQAMTFVIHFELICHRIFFVVAGLFDRNSDTRTSGY